MAPRELDPAWTSLAAKPGTPAAPAAPAAGAASPATPATAIPGTPPAAAAVAAPTTSPVAAQSDAQQKAATPVPGSNLEPDNHAGRFAFDLLSGIEISQKRDAFSQVDPYLRFVGDTAWRSRDSVKYFTLPNGEYDERRGTWFTDWTNVHTWIDLSLESVPVEGDAAGSSGTEEFIDSRKSFQGVVGADWRLIGMAPGNSWRTFGDKYVVEPYRMFVGPTARIGVQTIDDSQLAGATFQTDDRTARHWGVGLKLGDHRLEQVGRPSAGTGKPDAEIDFLNPGIRRYLAVYYGQYETFDQHKWTVEGMLRTDGKPGLFVGFTAILGQGEDDITIWVGVSYGIDQLVGLFDGLLPG